MNKLILIKTNVNMKQIESIKVGVGGEILSAEVKTIKTVSAEQFCQIYLRDNEEFYKLSKAESNVLAVLWYTSNYYEDKDRALPGNKISLDEELRDTIKIKTNLAAGTIRNTITSLVKKKMLLKDSRYKAVYYLNPEYFFKGKISDRTQIIKNIIAGKHIKINVLLSFTFFQKVFFLISATCELFVCFKFFCTIIFLHLNI